MLTTNCNFTATQNQVCFQEHCFNVEVVVSQEERTRGLQKRPSLPEDRGMLFIFDQEAKHAFWMKDTYIPLDIVWMDYSKNIVHIEENVKPCRIAPCPLYHPAQNALYALELNAGQTEKIGLKVGDQADFRLKDFPSR